MLFYSHKYTFCKTNDSKYSLWAWSRRHNFMSISNRSMASFHSNFFSCFMFFPKSPVRHREKHSIGVCKTGGVTELRKKKTAISFSSMGLL